MEKEREGKKGKKTRRLSEVQEIFNFKEKLIANQLMDLEQKAE